MKLGYKFKLPTLLGLGLMILGLSCDDDPADDVALPETSHRVVMTSEMDFDNKVNLNEDITFGDVSTGVENRTWTFPEGVVDIAGSDNDATSSEATVRAYFKKIGDHEVKLQQTFQSDAYVGTTKMGKELDTTFIVRVLGAVKVSISANIVNSDGTLGDALTIGDNAKNEVMAGSTVRYTVATEGEPENYIWTVNGGDPESSEVFEDELDVKYKKLGSYDFSFAANRERPEGGTEVTYKNLITIIPSTEPVTLDAVNEKDGNIALNFSREMEESTLNPEDFSVSVVNGGADVPVTIESVTVDPDEGNLVIIKLAGDRIYNDDTVTVSYTAGSMATTDAYPAESFTDQQVVFKGENIFEGSAFDYSFENYTAANWPYQWWGAPYDGYTFEISTAQTYDGAKSAYVEMQPNGGMIIANVDSDNAAIPFSFETGQWYEIGIWVYVESVTPPDTGDMFNADVRFFWFPDVDWGVGPNPDLTAIPAGEWVYSSQLVQFSSEAPQTFSIRGYNASNTTATRFYMDNISISKASLRP
ncbi:hypothetical protein [Zobellia galactanivorans]|uniref:hypothetical protein n=1 Tax=Zobellia galactanivorans (strain DSM 12802 / CCUG 47099 / CIP 106680 / NCIMB 13871 / Dsij) TaxID=63186 RepID=UPI001C0679B6|nr:hypothetical protein [Zobellia galactanivorans]MBU3026235.1 hypothetical protein [Zobellia galactanivorans]